MSQLAPPSVVRNTRNRPSTGSLKAIPYAYVEGKGTDSKKSSDLKLNYGVTDYITLGTQLQYQWRDSLFNGEREGDLLLSFSNMPLREYGAYSATSFEYDYGYLPKKNEIKGNVLYQLPFYGYEKNYRSLFNDFIGAYRRKSYSDKGYDFIERSWTNMNEFYKSGVNLKLLYGITNDVFVACDYDLLLKNYEHFIDLAFGKHTKHSVFTFTAVMISMVDEDDYDEEDYRDWLPGIFEIKYQSSF